MTAKISDSMGPVFRRFAAPVTPRIGQAARSMLIALTLATFALGAPARAADTVETWAVGATDVDYYVGADGLRGSRLERTVYTDLMLGYGLVEGLSAYLGICMEGNGYLTTGTPALYTGLFGTVVEADHVDFDLFLDVAAGGPGLSELALTPAFELNFDLDPDMLSWGAYLRFGFPLIGQSEPVADDPEALSHDTLVHFEPVLGTYWTPRAGHQILLEVDALMHATPSKGERRVDLGGVALGYNVGLGDAIELITQLQIDVPLGDESVDLGGMIGIIATLPGAG